MKRTGFVITATLALFAAAELGARALEWWRPADRELRFGYAPYRMMKMVEAPFALNSDGFRAAELSTYRREDRFKVVFLGASVCLGVGYDTGPTLAELLESALHVRGLTRLSVINLCQGGATARQELDILLDYGLPLKPQAVISFNGANDLMHAAPLGPDAAPNLPYRDREMRALWPGGHSILAHLALVRGMGRLARRREPALASETVPTSVILQSYFSALEVTRGLAERARAQYAVILQPTVHFQKPWSSEEQTSWRERYPQTGERVSGIARLRYQETAAEAARWAARTGAALFDLSDAFARVHETIYSDSVHFRGPRGNQILAGELERRGLFDQLAEQYRAWESAAWLESKRR
jgi:hypothetical protein